MEGVRRKVLDERRVLLGMYGVTSSARYEGWLTDWREWVRLATLYFTLLLIGSQWCSAKSLLWGTCSLEGKVSRARLFWMR